MDFPGSSDGEESACNAGDQSSIPGSGRPPGEGNDKPTPVFFPEESHGERSLGVSEYLLRYLNISIQMCLSWSVSAERTPPTCSGCGRSMAARAQQREGAVGLTAMNTEFLLILPLRTGSQFAPHWAERRKHMRLLYQVNPKSLIHLS